MAEKRQNEKQKILLIGAAHIDFKYTPSEKLVLGSSNPVDCIRTLGGVALNMARNLASLKQEIAIFSMIGCDENGIWLRRKIKALGIDDGLLFESPSEPTGHYVSILDDQYDLHLGLASTQIYNSLIPELFEGHYKTFNLYDHIVIDANLPEASLAKIVAYCQFSGMKLSINPVSKIKARKIPRDLRGLFLLVLNEEEAGEVLSSSKNIGDYEGFFQESGVLNLVITKGENGLSWFSTESGSGTLRARPLESASIRDVSGAGDSLTAGLIYELSRGKSLQEAAEFGQKLAVATIQSPYSALPHGDPFWKTV